MTVEGDCYKSLVGYRFGYIHHTQDHQASNPKYEHDRLKVETKC